MDNKTCFALNLMLSMTMKMTRFDRCGVGGDEHNGLGVPVGSPTPSTHQGFG